MKKTKTTNTSATMWGGRFKAAPDPRLRALNDSLAFDWELVEHDVRGSIAWAGALESAGVLSANEATRMTGALRGIAREVTSSVSGTTPRLESRGHIQLMRAWGPDARVPWVARAP